MSEILKRTLENEDLKIFKKFNQTEYDNLLYKEFQIITKPINGQILKIKGTYEKRRDKIHISYLKSRRNLFKNNLNKFRVELTDIDDLESLYNKLKRHSYVLENVILTKLDMILLNLLEIYNHIEYEMTKLR